MSDTFRATDHDMPLAADQVGNVKYLKTKMAFGANDSATEVSNENPLPVNIGSATISLSSGAFNVTFSSGTFALLSGEVHVMSGNINSYVTSGNINAVINSGNINSYITSGNVNAVINSGNINSYITSGNINAVINSGNINAVINSGNINARITSGNVNSYVTSGYINILNSGSVVSNTNPLPVTATSGGLGITLVDSPAIDAFGRLRVSEPYYVFDAQNQYDTQPLLFDTAVTNSGSVTHLPNESSVQLNLNTASGNKVIRQSKQYFRYQPGKSSLIFLTGVLGLSKTNLRRRIGYFDGRNGMFFEQIAPGEGTTGLRIVIRTSTSGSPIDTAEDQNSWNIDKMNGSGPSGIDLEMDKAQIFVIDFEWLGVGRVRFGFVIDGLIYYCHEVLNSNVITSVYTTTANLPVRCEMENLGTTTDASTMKSICTSISSEGGYNKVGFSFSASNGITTKSVTTRVPILSIRQRTTFNGIENRMEFDITNLQVFASTYSAFYEIVLNGVLTSENFVNVNSGYSGMSYDTSATAISGGIVIAQGYAAAGGPGSNAIGLVSNQLTRVPIGLDIDGTNPDIITIVATCMEASPKASVISALFSWQEIR